jgi:hypothetical protein
MKIALSTDDMLDANGEHYAILEFITEYIHTPGDERSKTNPGHGYPETIERKIRTNYITFDSKEELENYVLKSINKYDSNKNFVVLKSNIIKHSLSLKLKLDD